MFRTILLLASLASLCLLAAFAISCGGSSSTGPHGGCTGGPYTVTGDWTLTVTATGGSSSGPGVIDSSGLAVFFQTTTSAPAPGDTVIMPTISGTCSFSGDASAYGTPASGGGSAPLTVNGNVTSASAISGTLSDGNTFALTPNTPLTGAVTVPSSLMYAAVEGAATADLFQVGFGGTASSMTLDGTDNLGCTFSGTLTQAGANNVFDASLTFSGTNCPSSTPINGVGFESNSDYFGFSGSPQVTGTYFYLVSSKSAFVFEIYPPPGV